MNASSVIGYRLSTINPWLLGSRLMRVRVEAGHDGLRSGEGFYRWPPERAQEVIQRRNADLLRRRVADLG